MTGFIDFMFLLIIATLLVCVFLIIVGVIIGFIVSVVKGEL